MQYIGDTTPDQAYTLFEKFYGTDIDMESEEEGSARLKEELVKQAQELKVIIKHGGEKGRTISMAALQGLFIRNGNDSAGAIEGCREHFGVQK